MRKINNRLAKIENRLNITDENQIITFLGIKMTMGSFTKMLQEISGNSKSCLPSIEETGQYEQVD